MNESEFQQYIKVSESKSVDVLLWLLNNRDDEDVINATLHNIARECIVTKVTVNRVFQRLYDKGFLIKIRNGQYQMRRV